MVSILTSISHPAESVLDSEEGLAERVGSVEAAASEVASEVASEAKVSDEAADSVDSVEKDSAERDSGAEVSEGSTAVSEAVATAVAAMKDKQGA
jgi:hypothetical protein